MLFERIIIDIYFFIVLIGIISSGVLIFRLKKYTLSLPESWKNAAPLKNFRLSICLLMVFLILVLSSDITATYLARNQIYNHFVFSIYYTVSTPFLFGFLFINTQTTWKKTGYSILYTLLLVYLISGKYYHPKSVYSSITDLIINSTYFLAFLLHLTDLLINPKQDYFKFQIKINLAFLIWSLVSAIVSSFLSTSFTEDDPYFSFFFLFNVFSMHTLYLSCAFFFIIEILKLRPSLDHSKKNA